MARASFIRWIGLSGGLTALVLATLAWLHGTEPHPEETDAHGAQAPVSPVAQAEPPLQPLLAEPTRIDLPAEPFITCLWPPDATPMDPPHELSRIPSSGSPSIPCMVGASRCPMPSGTGQVVLTSFRRRVATLPEELTATPTLDLGALPSLRGRVVGAGRGLARARVELARAGGRGDTLLVTWTSTSGDFRFTAIPGDWSYVVRAQNDGWLPASSGERLAIVNPEPLMLELTAAETLLGVVVSADGEPVPLASLRLEQGARIQRATADGQGGFSLIRERAQTGWLTAQSPSGDQGHLEITPHVESPVTLRLAASETLRGRALWDDGEPASHVALHAFPSRRYGQALPSLHAVGQMKFARTDYQGYFVLDRVSGERLVFSSPAAPGWSSELDVTEEAVVVLPKTANHMLQVQPYDDVTGEPPQRLATVRGSVEYTGDALSGSRQVICTALDERTVHVALPLPPDLAVRLNLAVEGYSPAQVASGRVGELAGQTLRVPLQALRRVEVWVTDEAGHPLEGALVQVRWPLAGDQAAPVIDVAVPSGESWFPGRLNSAASGPTDGQGHFAGFVPPGAPLRFSVEANGHEPVHRSEWGGRGDVIEVALRALGSVAAGGR